jgi:predicted anti-sigma-YlaC factor YlaD
LKETNMTCNKKDINELLPDLAAGLASATPEVNDHLRACSACTETLTDLRKTMALLDEWQTPEPSPYFDTRLRARLREEAAKQPAGWWAWARRPAMAVSLAVVMVAGVSVYRMEQKPVTGPGPNTAGQLANADVQPGTAVGDLQTLDKNHDVFTDSDPDTDGSLLDDLQVQNDVSANP